MSRSIRRRVGVIAGLLVCTATSFSGGLFVVGAAPAGAATIDPCKVLKKSEIQQAFAGTVSSGKHGISTPVSAQCEYTLGANGDHPTGTVIVHVMTTGAKAAYDGLKKKARYEPIDGVPNSLWADTTHVVDILKGKVLLGVQGNFILTDPLPIHDYDAKTQLTQLAKTGASRV